MRSADAFISAGKNNLEGHLQEVFASFLWFERRFSAWLMDAREAAPSMSLYLYQNNQQTGPFTEDQIGQMLRTGIISPDTLGWKEGMSDWEPLSGFTSLANTGLPPTPPVRKSPLSLISFIFSLISLVGWLILLVTAGIAHNAGTATPAFNMIVGFLFLGGVCLNFTALVLGLIGAFKSRANTLAIIGASLNGFQILALIALIIIGLTVKHAQ
jgi:hypothetical protein